jgi:predicted transcriptional regulator
MNNWNKIKKEILKDKEVKQIYNDLDLEYKLIRDIIKYRTKNKITQVGLAKKIGTTQSALARFESGQVNPTIGFIKKVADGIGAKLEIRLA